MFFCKKPQTKTRYDKSILADIEKSFKENDMRLELDEAYFLVELCRAMQKVEGDFCEVGVYQGGSARLMNLNKAGKKLFLFDNFGGLPKPMDWEPEKVKEGKCCGLKERVLKSIGSLDRVIVTEGFFPKTASALGASKLAFVHLDVDQYTPTKESLEEIYDRVCVGGAILVHDYNQFVGVKRAVDEFFSDKKESVVSVNDTQCLIIKMG